MACAGIDGAQPYYRTDGGPLCAAHLTSLEDMQRYNEAFLKFFNAGGKQIRGKQ
ncbi:hypothetical protein [Methylobacterium sp. NEAU K]|uniref:hypothetical protein n=1 Tax=Methylobacterium sp. NEAU K TaxID=3064946 RepID=UPI002736D530|nr:hypothetical protein [Methylobacterium sp. NEAU K]MDP4005167.1 hypothetical protein [Methylobacterium sp. NEAU K]